MLIFFTDLTKYDHQKYQELFDCIQEIVNSCYEGILFIKNIFTQRTNSQTIDILLREYMKMDDILQRIEKDLEQFSDDIHDELLDN